jgi:hypothetical protein
MPSRLAEQMETGVSPATLRSRFRPTVEQQQQRIFSDPEFSKAHPSRAWREIVISALNEIGDWTTAKELASYLGESGNNNRTFQRLLLLTNDGILETKSVSAERKRYFRVKAS